MYENQTQSLPTAILAGVDTGEYEMELSIDELRELAAGLKVLNAGIKDSYASDFVDPYFEVAAQAEGEDFRVDVSFYLPNTMDGDDTAQVEAVMTKAEMKELIAELDSLCEKFPDRE